MNLKKVFCKRKMAIGVLAAVYLFSWVANILAEDEEIDPRKNIIAIHDSSSEEYKKNCSECHADIPNAQSLEPSIAPAAHVAMFDFAPGKPGDDKQCIWCHRTVDLVQGSAGNIRKQVDATLCTLCHGAPPREVINNKEPERSATAKQFYQAGLSPTDPDGPALYDLACAACHRNPENSQVKGARTDQIQRAIEKDKGEMGPLTVLSTEEIQSIAIALGNQDSPEPEVIDLYITKAEWKADKSELKVEGRESAGSEVEILYADSSENLGSATTDEDGKWKFRLKNPAKVPCRVQAESGSQFLENDVKNAPDNCGE